MTVTRLAFLAITRLRRPQARRGRARRERRSRHRAGSAARPDNRARRTGRTLPSREAESPADLVAPGYVAWACAGRAAQRQSPALTPGQRRRRRRLDQHQARGTDKTITSAIDVHVVSGLERKNGWTLAAFAGDATPDGMQRLLNAARWDAGRVGDTLGRYVAAHLGDPAAVLVADDTGFESPGGVRRGCSGSRPAPPGRSPTARSECSWPMWCRAGCGR
jgi:hypothetical protein